MNHPPVLFAGILAIMASSWFGFILVPQAQLGGLKPVEAQTTGNTYPQARPGAAEQGRDVYRSLGCVACHTQHVRPVPADTHRFGPIPTVARDYLFDTPALIGTIRIGPDLSNAGMRMPSTDWHLRHLFDPKLVVQGSTMPPYPFLFDKTAASSPPDDNEISIRGQRYTPKPEALALVDYLKSLKVDAYLFERPSPPAVMKPEVPVASTNNVPAAPAAAAAGVKA